MTDTPDNQHYDESDIAVEAEKPKLQHPKMYKVILLNDDYTPMDFVIDVLMKFFSHNQDQATQIMLSVHTKGMGICGVFTREIAETKVYQVNEFSRSNQHPLMCTMEEA
ncbi:MAG: ATP-dependent Clp protease adapter ClpS [Methylococcales bacterium]|jgi:ATP-dependent Clp protease adaptor protein ClpS|nr:ATP-dependent Clp protease adapter ClpS [Methylococcales bacterium]MBT7409339.1 ATP-dependent Clp protease adapter ClpS [Methylococcales bacterium]